MKSTIYFAFGLLTLGFSACGSENGAGNNLQVELENVRKEIATLQAKEKELLKKIGTDSNARTKLVETQNIGLSTFSSELSVEGMVDAQNSTIATAKVPGTVTQLLVTVGQNVKKGQVLAQLDNTSLVQSRRELQQQLDFAKTLYEKQLRLWKQGVGTEVQYLSAKNQMEALEKSVATLNANIEMYQIKSPIDGSVEAVDLKIGQMAAPGMPYFKVVNLGQVKVIAEISEAYAGKVQQGDAVGIYLPDLSDTLSAKVAFASKFIDPLNRTFKVEVPIKGNAGIKPNMIAKLQIREYEKPNAIVVPTNCIQTTEDESFVMLAVSKDEQTLAKKQKVTLGLSNKNQSQVLSGLKTGDVLIVNGFQELAEGQLITIKGN